MKNKNYILKQLQEADDFLSGEELAETLHITRAAVWQSIRDLRKAGFHIEAVTNRGYRLNRDYEPLAKEKITSCLMKELKEIDVLVEQSVTSTNDAIFQCDDESPLPSFSFMVAEEQTAGKGRVGKSFLSPFGSGLYLSAILKGSDHFTPELLTLAAAVAAREAIGKQTKKPVLIKWVNDLYLDHKKIAGILTEANFSSSSPRYVVGIGINTDTPRETFDKKELLNAGSIGESKLSRNQLAADFMNALYSWCARPKKEILDDYRKYNLTIGKTVAFSKRDIEYTGKVKTIDDDGGLVVEVDGSHMTLTAGAISIRGDW